MKKIINIKCDNLSKNNEANKVNNNKLENDLIVKLFAKFSLDF